MAKKETPACTVLPLLDPVRLYDGVIREVLGDQDLKSKYLYLGWQGARAWKGVDSNYLVNKVGIKIIQENITAIDAAIRERHPEGYDIVSLGSGSGVEDETILRQLAESPAFNDASPPDCRVFTVDISIDLLIEGVRRLDDLRTRPSAPCKWMRSLTAINLDIEDLKEARDVFSRGRGSRVTLFHLLGLTLGNNDEERLFKAINSAMQPGDFLLVSVDFCADSDEQLAKTEKLYNSPKTINFIQAYLTSPLTFASSYKPVAQGSMLRATNRYSQLNIKFKMEPRRSHIPGTKTFVFSYELEKENDQRLVCYAHKYRSEDFMKYVTAGMTGVRFEVIENVRAFGDDKTGQYLVLLRKPVNPPSGTTRQRSSSVAQKHAQEAISLLEKRIALFKASEQYTSDKREVVKMLSEVKDFLKDSSADTNLIISASERIKAASRTNSLHHTDEAQAIVDLIRQS